MSGAGESSRGRPSGRCAGLDRLRLSGRTSVHGSSWVAELGSLASSRMGDSGVWLEEMGREGLGGKLDVAESGALDCGGAGGAGGGGLVFLLRWRQ